MTKGSVDDGVVFHAGFPNAAEDAKFGSLSLDKLVIRHQASTFFWRLKAAVEELQWPAGSIVVVDRTLDPKEGSYVVVAVEDDFLLSQMKQNKLVSLEGLLIDGEVTVWGVATYCLQDLQGRSLLQGRTLQQGPTLQRKR